MSESSTDIDPRTGTEDVTLRLSQMANVTAALASGDLDGRWQLGTLIGRLLTEPREGRSPLTLTSGHHPDDGTKSHPKVLDVPAAPWHETKNQSDLLTTSNRQQSAQEQGRATNSQAFLDGASYVLTEPLPLPEEEVIR